MPRERGPPQPCCHSLVCSPWVIMGEVRDREQDADSEHMLAASNLLMARRFTNPADVLAACAGCHAALYCSARCQKKDWAGEVNIDDGAASAATTPAAAVPPGIARLTKPKAIDLHRFKCLLRRKAGATGAALH